MNASARGDTCNFNGNKGRSSGRLATFSVRVRRRKQALLRNYVSAVWNAGNPNAAEHYLAPDFRRHTSATAPPLDVMGQLQRLRGFREAFPDVAITIEDVIATPDRVAFRSTMRGTHLGTFLGIAPTGREVLVGLIDVIRIENGRFVEQWGGPDLFDLMRQLGAA